MLKDWFSSLPVYEIENADNISALLEDFKHQSLTGLVRWDISAGDLYLWTFVKGEGNSLFKYENEQWNIIPKGEWLTWLYGPPVTIYKSNLSVQGTRASEVILTAPIVQKNSMRMSGTELLTQVQTWFKQPDCGFVHCKSEYDELFGLKYGDGISNMEVLFFKDKQSMFSVEQPDDLPIYSDLGYQVEFYSSDRQQEIWIVNQLRFAFTALVRMSIQRFGYMVGFSLADRLCSRLSEVAHAHDLDVKLTTNGMENGQIFHSLEEASESYSMILKHFIDEASVLIGPRMAKEIAMNMLEKLSQVQRDLLADNLRELKGPKFNLANSQGKQWIK